MQIYETAAVKQKPFSEAISQWVGVANSSLIEKKNVNRQQAGVIAKRASLMQI